MKVKVYERWSRTDRVTGSATLVLSVSLFLPWFEYAGQTTNGLWHGFEYITLGSSLAILTYLVLRQSLRSMPLEWLLPHNLVLPAATALNLALVLIGFLARPTASGLAFTITANWDFGAFLGVVAAFVAAGAVIGPRLRESVGGGM